MSSSSDIGVVGQPHECAGSIRDIPLVNSATHLRAWQDAGALMFGSFDQRSNNYRVDLRPLTHNATLPRRKQKRATPQKARMLARQSSLACQTTAGIPQVANTVVGRVLVFVETLKRHGVSYSAHFRRDDFPLPARQTRSCTVRASCCRSSASQGSDTRATQCSPTLGRPSPRASLSVLATCQ